MAQIQLKYGTGQVFFDYSETQFQILDAKIESKALTDVEIGAALDTPIDAPPLEEIVKPGESVLFVVPDATRQAAAGQIVNLVVRRLIANGTLPGEIACIFANGIHRPVSETEKQAILTPFIAQRIKTFNHHAEDLMSLIRIGKTDAGIPIEINRLLKEYDHPIIVSGVSFHYFAGFSGGRKMICPGLASKRTVSATHRLAFDFEHKTRRAGVGVGLLTDNPVHEAFVEIVEKINPSFSINSIVNDDGEAVKIFAGDWRTAHQAACDFYAEENTVRITEKRDLVIISSGGLPADINMIQAHKALETAAAACRASGTIIWLAECADGLGRADFLSWFDAGDSEKLAANLVRKYQVNGQTAWSLLKKAETYDVRIVTGLSQSQTEKMRLTKINSVEEALSKIPSGQKGYVIPSGAKIRIETV